MENRNLFYKTNWFNHFDNSNNLSINPAKKNYKPTKIYLTHLIQETNYRKNFH